MPSTNPTGTLQLASAALCLGLGGVLCAAVVSSLPTLASPLHEPQLHLQLVQHAR